MWPWQVVDCPKCAQLAGKRFRTLKTGRSTDTHHERFRAYNQERDQRR